MKRRAAIGVGLGFFGAAFGARGQAHRPSRKIGDLHQRTLAPAFAAAALEHRLPAFAFLKTYARSGVLMTYGPTQEAYFPRAVILADKILKGEKPGEVPIEGPDRFELVINLATARVLGLAIPQALRVRADEVVE